MKRIDNKIIASALIAMSVPLTMSAANGSMPTELSAVCQSIETGHGVKAVNRLNRAAVEIIFENNQRMTIDFYGNNIFRVFQDNNGGILRNPKAEPEAQILCDTPRQQCCFVNIGRTENIVFVKTERTLIEFDRKTGLMTVKDQHKGSIVMEETAPAEFKNGKFTLRLKGNENEYFYGGGVQNGRFSHKGNKINIVNENSWTDGGVASPTPFYWSTQGYGILFHTFKPGSYDFGSKEADEVVLSHDEDYLDAFIMLGKDAVEHLNNFYQLTGNPVLLPKFGLYEGHLNAYNRDYWKEDDKRGILFEDGKKYKESQKDNGGIKESLNGEKGNYQFSARAVIDRYKAHDMPLGWILPNDGYGAGYGQTETLDGNIANLKELGDYARKNGVEIGLWTQSDLHPKKGIEALLQRDIVKEIRDAGVRVLKTDVAWVGAGYSFGLNGVADVGQIMPYYGNDARPFIISLDGWAGTQQYAAIWSGDQTGGLWEYIRFHIPTYIGSGLSGQPNITSDMDGIFGGKNMAVNIRDFQWKTWTPMQLNMDGWGSNPKYPHILGEPAASINRMYLKLKSELLPYTYSIAKEAVDGLPMIRAMFLEYPNAYTQGKATQYQYMYGKNFLVAPIYQATYADEEGNDLRDGIYLPEGRWIDYFTGNEYEGGRIINNFDAPIWKLPVFVRKGAIIPMANPSNNPKEVDKQLRIYDIYPCEYSYATEYDDDGTTMAYTRGKGVKTFITSRVDKKGNADIHIDMAEGRYKGYDSNKTTWLRINVTEAPKAVTAKIANSKVKLMKVNSLEALAKHDNCYYYEAEPEMNRFATKGSDFEKQNIIKNPVLHVKLAKMDVNKNAIDVKVKGFKYDALNRDLLYVGALATPQIKVTDENIEAYTIQPEWNKIENAGYYEIDFNGMLYSTIKRNALLFTDLTPDTEYTFKLRAVNREGKSEWSECKVRTKRNPLEFAIRGIHPECTANDQSGTIRWLADFDDVNNIWHTQYGKKAVPFDLVLDLNSFSTLDKLHYLGRLDSGNGTFLKGTISYSRDKENWSEPVAFDWKRDAEVKEFVFADHPTARYVKFSVTEAVGNYGTAREIYVFKVPGSASTLPGDINKDNKVDENDLTSYMNYTGLRQTDSDFGYVSVGDINQNGLIDAFDISNVAVKLEEGADTYGMEKLAGRLDVQFSQKSFKKGDVVTITVKGTDLKEVNALSMALPYDAEELEFNGIDMVNMKEMTNLTYDRLHTNGEKALYPTFVNTGNKPTLEGTDTLFIIKMKAKKNGTVKMTAKDILLVDKALGVKR